MKSPFEIVKVSGVPFQATDRNAATDWLIDLVTSQADQAVAVRLANAYCVSLAQTDAAYARIISEDGVTFPDGAPVGVAMRLLARREGRRPMASTVRGPSFFRDVLDKGRPSGVRHFFVGASKDTLAMLIDVVEKEYPGVDVVGSYSPPFAALDEKYIENIVTEVGFSEPSIVWLGLGTPKQDFAASMLASRLRCPVVGVGAAFDFVAGNVQEAPSWLHGTGLEWVYRFAKEPKRLWRRYLFGNAIFVESVVRQLFTRSANRVRRQ